MSRIITPQFIYAVRTMAESLPIYTGTDTPQNRLLVRRCSWAHAGTGTRLIFTRDGFFHEAGWIKNPTFNQCYHLSLSFADPVTQQPAQQRRTLADLWCTLLFHSKHLHKLLVESPKSPEGTALEVWHYRLFCDAYWHPIVPRGEPYHTLLTEIGWRSWSERHAQKPSIILPAGMEG